ncbi:MAG: septum site-determining protein MinD [Synergistales bacterium]|nr:septum site-determining protein MinD [Synergistales bacterium]
MDSRVIVVTSGKGGVGKTTLTANLSVSLASRGYKVAAIDADIGLRNLDVMLGLENRIVYTIVDYVEGNCKLHQALVRDKRVPNLHLLPAAQTRTKDAIKAEEMEELGEALKRDFDFVLVDSPAGIESGFRNAAVAADEAIVVATPEVASVRDADRIIGLLESMGKSPIRLVLNRIRPGMVKKGDMLDVPDVLDILAIELVGIIPEDDRVLTSSNKGEPLTMRGHSPATKAFTNIGSRLIGEDIPFMDLVERAKGGVFGKVKELFGL